MARGSTAHGWAHAAVTVWKDYTNLWHRVPILLPSPMVKSK